MSLTCTTHDWGCIFHACMSDDCQREVMKKEDAAYYEWFSNEFGPAKCEKQVIINKKSINESNQNLSIRM